MKNIQCDDGAKFYNGYFWELRKTNGISFLLSCTYSSSQNDKTERKICTINNIVRTLLDHAFLLPTFWPRALQMATYILNMLPSKQLNYKSPLQILYNKTPSYPHLRVFGCLWYPLYPSITINKLQVCTAPFVFLAFPPNHRGYKYFDISSHKIINCCHVIFDETQFLFASLHHHKLINLWAFGISHLPHQWSIILTTLLAQIPLRLVQLDTPSSLSLTLLPLLLAHALHALPLFLDRASLLPLLGLQLSQPNSPEPSQSSPRPLSFLVMAYTPLLLISFPLPFPP